MKILRLKTLDGFIVFDSTTPIPCAGGTRAAPDVSEAEVAALARGMTYKFAVLGLPIGGGKAGIRLRPDAVRDEVLQAYCDEIRPLVESGTFNTGADLGTRESDFRLLRAATTNTRSLMAEAVDGIPLEELLTGHGVAAAAAAAAGDLEGRTVSIEGLGKVGCGVARAMVARGARIVAVSTQRGCAARREGFDLEELIEARVRHADDLVFHLGTDTRDVEALFDVPVDILVPCARPGVITKERAGSVRVGLVAPGGNIPYCAGAPEILGRRGIVALADFVCNLGAVIGYQAPSAAQLDEVFRATEQTVAELVSFSLEHPSGPFHGACAIAEDFLWTWRAADNMPSVPPLAFALN
jgi:glutamate dehydrogenase/leucine dehydrogenase